MRIAKNKITLNQNDSLLSSSQFVFYLQDLYKLINMRGGAIHQKYND